MMAILDVLALPAPMENREIVVSMDGLGIQAWMVSPACLAYLA